MNGKILVVEDEARLREPIEYLLAMRQYEVVTADTAEEAIAAIETHTPAGAIVDLQLKRGHGRDVVGRMPPGTPVIIFSGMKSASEEVELDRPRTRLVEKPASLTWLIDALDEMLGTVTRVEVP